MAFNNEWRTFQRVIIKFITRTATTFYETVSRRSKTFSNVY